MYDILTLFFTPNQDLASAMLLMQCLSPSMEQCALLPVQQTAVYPALWATMLLDHSQLPSVLQAKDLLVAMLHLNMLLELILCHQAKV